MVHTLGYQLDIVINDHHRIVDNHAQRHYKAGEGHGVELYVKGIEESERDKDRHRNCRRSDKRHFQRQKNHDNDHHRDYGYQQLDEKIVDRTVDHHRLICYLEKRDRLRHVGTGLFKLRVDLLAHLYDIVTVFHAHAQEYAFIEIIGDIAVRIGIFLSDLGHIAEPDHTAVRGREHNHSGDIGHRIDRTGHKNGPGIATVAERASGGLKALCQKSSSYGLLRDGIVL